MPSHTHSIQVYEFTIITERLMKLEYSDAVSIALENSPGYPFICGYRGLLDRLLIFIVIGQRMKTEVFDK